MILKAYKYRLYPKPKQKQLLAKHFGCVRYIYNWGLNQKIEQYQKTNKSDSCITLMNEIVVLKKQEETKWLSEVNAQALQMSLRNLDNAFTRFFREKKGFPKFKKRKNRQSFQCPQDCSISFDNQKLSIPKFRRNNKLKIKISRTFTGKMKTVTISKNTAGQYFVSILVETPGELPKKPPVQEKTTIGIDLGLKDFATLSTGEKIANPRHLNSSKKLKYKQYLLSRRDNIAKNKKGQNREKLRLKLAKQYKKITNQRLDFLHKLSYKLTHNNQVNTICMEDLNVSGMMKNHKLARSISDVSWSKFLELLKYKCEWYGKNLFQIGRFEPSSKMCTCGKLNNELKLKDREWTCDRCGVTHDRDVLAANNIKRFGLIRLKSVPWEAREQTPLETAQGSCFSLTGKTGGASAN